MVTLRLFASGNVTDFESENESSVRRNGAHVTMISDDPPTKLKRPGGGYNGLETLSLYEMSGNIARRRSSKKPGILEKITFASFSQLIFNISR